MHDLTQNNNGPCDTRCLLDPILHAARIVVCTHHCRKRHVVFCCGPMQHLRLYRLCSGVSRTRIERSCCLHGHTRRLAMSTMAIADSSYLTQSSLARSSASEPMHRSSRITWPGCGCGYVVAICRFVARITPGCYNAPACCSALHDAHMCARVLVAGLLECVMQ
jgi:hypothetical protein